jgi:hypothetical protein
MKEICIEFAEWVGINTFDGSYMRHEINSRGIHTWRLYNEHDYIMTNNLYQKFCDSKGIEFTIPQKISYWDGKFEPTNFVEYIGKRGLFYYRWSYKGVSQEPYWTKSGKHMGKLKFNTEELWNEFNK